jgi:hypothetical protein
LEDHLAKSTGWRRHWPYSSVVNYYKGEQLSFKGQLTDTKVCVVDGGGNIILKKIKLLMMPTIVVGLSACVTNTGSDPITLSSRVLSSYEHFKTLK